MSTQIIIVATLDTKGDEVGYLKQLIEKQGCEAVVVDVGTLGPPTITPAVSRDRVAEAAGSSMAELTQRNDRRLAVETMIRGASAVVGELFKNGAGGGIISIGGGTGTHIGTGVMRSLPLGVPKLMVSTVASRDMSTLIGTKDITVMHSVVDILGLNAVSRRILGNAAAAVVGMAKAGAEIRSDRPIIGLTSFGFITEGAMRVKAMLEEKGYEVAPFHANGTGGMALEDLVEQGLLHGVIDLALHEFADELYGGYCGGIGPGRLEAAGRRGIPQLVVPGGLDCIVLEFNSPETTPEAVKGRKVFWYDFRSGVRTNRVDVGRLATTIAEKLNRSSGPTCFMIPQRGWSEADQEGGPLWEPETNAFFVAGLRSRLASRVELVEVDAHINDEEFSRAAVAKLDWMMRHQSGKTGL